MQQLTTPPAMNSPYTEVSDNRAPVMPNSPALGAPMPGTTGGLPALSGLPSGYTPLASPLQGNADMGQAAPAPQPAYPQELPMAAPSEQASNTGYTGGYTPAGMTPPAQTLPNPNTGVLPVFAEGGVARAAERASDMGRYGDTMLVHMNPTEVRGLQALAEMQGTSLTVNPITGMPEAFSLGKLFKSMLPTLLGAGLTFIPGIGPLAAAGIVGAGSTALTGDIRKGLMAGLGAYGGASLAGALAPAAAGNVAAGAAAGGGGASQLVAQNAAKIGAENAAVEAAKQGVVAAGTDVAAKTAAETALKEALANQVTKAPGFLAKFGAEAAGGLGTGMLAKAAPMAAGLGILNSVSQGFTPGFKTPGGQIDNSYQGPYTFQKRNVIEKPTFDELIGSSAERQWFDVDQPEVYNMQGQIVQPGSETALGTPILQEFLNPRAKKGQNMYSFGMVPYGEEPVGYNPYGMQSMQRGPFGLPMPAPYAKGGEVELADGAFVMDARTVSELGNGSSGAGQELLARMGGRPVRGPGDGVSDSIPARIGRDQPARVARDEVIFDPEAVRKIGKGDQKKGAQKLYAMMDKAHKARKKAGRGSDTKLRKGLA